MQCHSHYSFYVSSDGRGPESVGLAGDEGLRAFSELNYALEVLFPKSTGQISDTL